MAESISPDPETEFLSEHSVSTDLEEELYYTLKLDQVASGAKTWVVRNFDADSGKVYSLFFLSRELAIVETDDQRMHRVYIKTFDQEMIAIADHNSVWDAVCSAESHFGLNEN